MSTRGAANNLRPRTTSPVKGGGNMLSEILSSRVRAEIFRLLFDGRKQELHIRAIERRSTASFASIRQELKKISRLELVSSRRDGNRLYFKANALHPLYPALLELVSKTVGFTALLQEALDVPEIQLAFVFGSLARNEERARSDIDLLVIGDTGLRKLSSLLSGLESKIGREINPHTYSKDEFRERKIAEDHFVLKVLKDSKIFIIGTEHELGRI